MKRESYILVVFIIILIKINLPAQVNSSLKINSKIIDSEWLSDHLNDPEVVILHVSPLKPEFDREHIPGARFLYSGRLTISTPGEQAVFIPDKEMKEILESLGISNSSSIVLTFMNGLLTSTSRVYIALDHLGLGDQTYILNGGVEAWKSAGKTVVKDIPVVKKGKLTLAPKGNVVYSTEWVIKNLKSPNVTLIDTRSAPFYVGTSGGPRYGHIPGALNIPIAKLYDEKNRFLPEEKLKEVFQNAGVKPENELVTYCFVGNAASIIYFVARSLGYNVHLYDGSMDEWGNRFDLPLEKVEIAKEVIPENVIPFESERWNIGSAKVVDFMGRKSLMGIASLKDVEFTDGVIEFDLAVNGERSFPGVTFRMQGDEDYERIYIRPHLPGIYQNVVQYEGTFRGLDSWQLYYGPGKTSGAVFPINEWFHVKVEVKETQARLFINDMNRPVMLITDLVHGISKGTLGLWGPADGSAYFSNFSCRIDNSLQFPPLPIEDNPFGIISDWEISKPDIFLNQDIEEYPSPVQLQNIVWQKVKSLPSGLVDISRYYGRIGQLPDIIRAKTELVAGKEESRKLAFGYSDVITVFLNGKLMFAGNSEYTSRDANFQGIIGFNDYIFLPLKKGKNELMIAVAESFGGWGFMFMDTNAV